MFKHLKILRLKAFEHISVQLHNYANNRQVQEKRPAFL
jgi:hypothetical protein